MAYDQGVVQRAVMPVRSFEPLSPNYSKAWIRPWLRVALLVIVVPAVVVLSLLLSIAVWSAVTGYWGPEWPTVWQDTAWTTGAWLSGVVCLIALVTRPSRRRLATWRSHRVRARRGL